MSGDDDDDCDGDDGDGDGDGDDGDGAVPPSPVDPEGRKVERPDKKEKSQGGKGGATEESFDPDQLLKEDAERIEASPEKLLREKCKDAYDLASVVPCPFLEAPVPVIEIH